MIYLIIAALIALADQYFKYFIVSTVNLGGYTDLLPGIIGLTHIHNTGAAFSILEQLPWLLGAISVVCSILIIIYIFKTDLGVGGKISLAAVLGGAIGNAIDRIMLGYVVDMFNLEFMNFAVFNVADCFIVCGGILFIIFYIAHSAKVAKETKRMPELDRLIAQRKAEQEKEAASETSDETDAPAVSEETESPLPITEETEAEVLETPDEETENEENS